MTKSVGRYKIIFSFFSCDSFNYIFKHFVIGESEEYRLNISIINAHMFHAVFLFITACKFVFFDALAHVIVNICCYYNAILSATIHCLSIYVVMLIFILNKPTVLLKRIEILYSRVIHFWVMLISSRFKINLWFDDMI